MIIHLQALKLKLQLTKLQFQISLIHEIAFEKKKWGNKGYLINVTIITLDIDIQLITMARHDKNN